MEIALHVVAGVFSLALAVVFLRAGWIKLATPIAQLAGSGLVWVTDIPAWTVRSVGTLEVIASVVVVGSMAARLAGVHHTLVSLSGVIAAGGLAALMLSAWIFHRARGEAQFTWSTNLALGALALATAASQLVLS